ncbi:S8 family serine peptidase [Chondromyces apiculatus]|uniref:Peptidase S8/S53 domain-containing protein n=1 Tax=Chondromyces apiculatus DSM 436 TaxID=1192034 RepID=A0A017T0P6_9BACT|nr:S8 family serine peptidase [Chondromyces apiculatus]EYF02435.1 Hypothetical protein CAP_7206 [Chondromyces apiculatus DSM 436]
MENDLTAPRCGRWPRTAHPSRASRVVPSAVACLLSVAGAACVEVTAPPLEGAAEEEVGEASEALVTGGVGCSGRQWIAVQQQHAACAVPPPGWNVSPLFGPTAPPGLSSLCRYESMAGVGAIPPSAVAMLHQALTAQGATEITEDCVVVEPLAGQFAAEVRPWLRAEMLEHLGAAGPLPAASKSSAVEIAVVDSSPDAVEGTIPHGLLEHGYTMAWIAREVACPPGACTGHVTTHLALPHVSNTSVNLLRGGYFGTRGQLAQAIFRAVEAWKGAYPARGRLVINLSVGWEPDAGCGDPGVPGGLSLSERAVFLALEHAACHGALVVAAAGNDPGGPQPIHPAGTVMPGGPVCPAAWSVTSAPSASRCAAIEAPGYALAMGTTPLLYAPSSAPSLPVDNALLFAVGGVDYADRPIVRARTGGSPRLAALAFGGVAGEDPVKLPVPLTGTSVAAAAVSGIAAALWAYRPDLTATEVMDLVYRSGTLLLRKADFAAPGVADEVRRVDRCQALVAGCPPGQSATTCPAQGMKCVPAPPAEATQNPAWSQALGGLLAGDVADAVSYAGPAQPLGTPIGSSLYRSLAAAPWVHPQPERPPCGACVFRRSDRRLYVEIGASFPTQRVLTGMTLTLTGIAPLEGRPHSVSLCAAEPSAGDLQHDAVHRARHPVGPGSQRGAVGLALVGRHRPQHHDHCLDHGADPAGALSAV